MGHIRPYTTRRFLDHSGKKAASLYQLKKFKTRIPPSWAVSWLAYENYLSGDEAVLNELIAEIQHHFSGGASYAVRSSANIEDTIDTSFAGQFNSVLNVKGHKDILAAIKAVWGQTCSPGVEAYLNQQGLSCQQLKMGVLIQEMVPPNISGVAFSKNPITGNHEIIVEAVRGSGEQLVQGGVTPLRWVQKWGTFIQEPDESSQVPQFLILDVIAETKRLAKLAGHPVDLEWVWDGKELYFVQMREITTLNIPVFSNRISKEFFPGLIKPLIWSINTPLVDGAWVDLFTEMIGPNDIDPMDLAGIFYHRAYFNMGAMGDIFEVLGIPRESLELLLGLEIEGPEKPSFKPSMKTYLLLPHLIGFLLKKHQFGKQAETEIKVIEQLYLDFDKLDLSSLSLVELQDKVDSLYTAVQHGAYFNITLPLLASMFDRSFQSSIKRQDLVINELSMYHDMPEMDALDPKVRMDEIACMLEQDQTSKEQLQQHGYAAIALNRVDGPIQQSIVEFITRFGHFSDSGNDFSQPPWRENPELVITMLLNAGGRSGRDDREKKHFEAIQLPFFKRILPNQLYQRARKFQYLRTYISSVYTFGYGLFRKFYLEIGKRFLEMGWLLAKEDIFYLNAEEIRTMIDRQLPLLDLLKEVHARQSALDADRDQVVPELIYGNEPVPLASVTGETLKGIATSHGTYSGYARVLMGLDDIDKIQDGEILVIPYSDVGWTPLFSRAGAVVAESGGILSHSSIIAREYKIPAVVSVSQACNLLDGKMVTVNGYSGEVIIHSLAV